MRISENKKKNKDYIKNFVENVNLKPLTQLDEEFEKYCQLYEERFGKKAYIAEPSGTKQKTMEAIAICLEKNEDLLDKLLYQNSDRFMWKEGDIRIADTQCELCKYNDKENVNTCSQYPDGKLEGVMTNDIRCPKWDSGGIVL